MLDRLLTISRGLLQRIYSRVLYRTLPKNLTTTEIAAVIFLTASGTENGTLVIRRAIESQGHTLEKFRAYHRIIRNMTREEFQQFNCNLIDIKSGENKCRRAYRYIQRVDEAHGFVSDERMDKLIADATATMRELKDYAVQFKAFRHLAAKWWCDPERIGCLVTETSQNYIKLHRIAGVSPQGYRYRLHHIGALSRHGDAYKWQDGDNAKLSVSVPLTFNPQGIWVKPLPAALRCNVRGFAGCITYKLTEPRLDPTARYLSATGDPTIASFPADIQAVILSYLVVVNV